MWFPCFQKIAFSEVTFNTNDVYKPHLIGSSFKLLWESHNANRKWLKIVFSITNCRFRWPVCNLKRCFNAYRSALLDSRDSLRLPPIQCVNRLCVKEIKYQKLKPYCFVSGLFCVVWCIPWNCQDWQILSTQWSSPPRSHGQKQTISSAC